MRPPLGCVLAAALAGCATAPVAPVFWREHAIGSQSTYDPLTSSLQYALDSIQVEKDFETDDFDDGLREVVHNLLSPGPQIEQEGGLGEFINKEVLPIFPHKLGDSAAILPNVFLHCLGGGMLFRKQAEWFDAHGWPAPWLLSGVLAVACEVVGEVVEKPVADDTDEIADFWLWRPLGMWLYADEGRARWIAKSLGPVDWPHQLIWDFADERFRNVGSSYVFRPSAFAFGSTRGFVYTGMTNLFGLSHDLANGDTFSWGGGASTVSIKPVDLRWSAGLFYERDQSLLASLLVNGAESYAARLNVYPGVIAAADSWLGRAGFFCAVTDDGDVVGGVQWELPIGVGG